jgi:hypothetical protein
MIVPPGNDHPDIAPTQAESRAACAVRHDLKLNIMVKINGLNAELESTK